MRANRGGQERVRAIAGGAAAAVVLVGSVYAILRVGANPGSGREPVPDGPPPGAEDPSNLAVLLEGGRFTRGVRDSAADAREGPRSTHDELSFHTRIVEPFWMQRHEVTNEEYARFDSTHVYPHDRARHPVADVTWKEAMRYAEWLGGTLPSEEQWQFAAEGTSGRTYPWGDAPPTCELAHFADCEPAGTVEVMSRPAGATPEGIHDLAGNVWEWVTPIWYEHGRTPVNDEVRRSRGGSFADAAFFLRARNRNNDFFEGFAWESVGFRVVWPADGG